MNDKKEEGIWFLFRSLCLLIFLPTFSTSLKRDMKPNFRTEDTDDDDESRSLEETDEKKKLRKTEAVTRNGLKTWCGIRSKIKRGKCRWRNIDKQSSESKETSIFILLIFFSWYSSPVILLPCHLLKDLYNKFGEHVCLEWRLSWHLSQESRKGICKERSKRIVYWETQYHLTKKRRNHWLKAVGYSFTTHSTRIPFCFD